MERGRSDLIGPLAISLTYRIILQPLQKYTKTKFQFSVVWVASMYAFPIAFVMISSSFSFSFSPAARRLPVYDTD